MDTKDFEQIALIPSGARAFGFDADLGSFVLFDRVEGDVANHRQIGRAVALAGTILILVERHTVRSSPNDLLR